MSNFNGKLLLENGNWRIRQRGGHAELWHIHKDSAIEIEGSTRPEGTMRCHLCHAKPYAELRGLVMIVNWER